MHSPSHARSIRALVILTLSALLFVAGLSVATSASAATDAQLSSRLATSVSSVRVSHRAKPLAVNAALSRVAAAHTALIVSHGALSSHFGGEATLANLMRGAGYNPAAGLAMVASSTNQASVLTVASAMASNAKVRPLILYAGFTQVGAAVRWSSSLHRYVMTILLARPLTTAAIWAARVVSQLNAERHAHGLAPLRANANLMSSAHSHNLAMAREDLMSHQVYGEAAYTRRISSAGYSWSYAGENIGWNSAMTLAGATALETAMYNEKAPNDGHRQNILSRNYSDVGIDIYLDTAHHKLWLTEDFGRR